MHATKSCTKLIKLEIFVQIAQIQSGDKAVWCPNGKKFQQQLPVSSTLHPATVVGQILLEYDTWNDSDWDFESFFAVFWPGHESLIHLVD